MAIVILLGLTVVHLEPAVLIKFVIGGILVILGLTVFLLGVDIGIMPIGERSGAALTEKRSLPLLLSVSFVIGFLVTIAEPDVQVLADQIRSVSPNVNKWGLVLMIAAGIGLFVALGLLRTVMSLSLRVLLIVSYVLVFILAFLSPVEFQGVAFDSGGATTGPMTVPFIMSLGVGVAAVRSKEQKGPGGGSQDDSFGLTGIASIGPIAAVCLYGIILARINPANVEPAVTAAANTASGAAGSAASGATVQTAALSVSAVISPFTSLVPSVIKEVSMALAPLVGMFLVFQVLLLKMPPYQARRVIKGLVYAYIGLIIFLVGVNGGFMPAGRELGEMLGSHASSSPAWKALVIAVGFVFGAVVVCAEPAVWVLTDQVESVSGGTIKRKVMLAALSVGVGLSIALAMCRVLYRFSLWYILVPGYAISLLLTLKCSKLFTGIAFDSGGVASGPMTSTFILSFTLGVSSASGGNPATDAFGVIALVAMTPLIAIQILGILFSMRDGKSRGKTPQAEHREAAS